MARPVPVQRAPKGLERSVSRLEKAAARLERLANQQANQQAGPPAGKSQPSAKKFPRDYDDEIKDIITAVRPFTDSGNDKLHALITATRHVTDHRLPGAVVEYGVGGGGAMQAVARTLLAAGSEPRDLYLLDTFEKTPLDEVKAGFTAVPYPAQNVRFGAVDSPVPDEIAVLRLGTDGYTSTRQALDVLYPRLVSGGVLLFEHYGWWQGARQATDEWMRANGTRLVLWRAGTGRVTIKP